MEKTDSLKAGRMIWQKTEKCARDFIGSIPVQTMLEISGGAFPFLHGFAPLYVRGLAFGFDPAVLQKARRGFTRKAWENIDFSTLLVKGKGIAGLSKSRQKYDVVFMHSIPPAAGTSGMFAGEVLPQVLQALQLGGKMLLIDHAAAERPAHKFPPGQKTVFPPPLYSEKAIKAMVQRAELNLIKIIEIPLCKTECAAADVAQADLREIPLQNMLRIYFIRNPQILIARNG